MFNGAGSDHRYIQDAFIKQKDILDSGRDINLILLAFQKLERLNKVEIQFSKNSFLSPFVLSPFASQELSACRVELIATALSDHASAASPNLKDISLGFKLWTAYLRTTPLIQLLTDVPTLCWTGYPEVPEVLKRLEIDLSLRTDQFDALVDRDRQEKFSKTNTQVHYICVSSMPFANGTLLTAEDTQRMLDKANPRIEKLNSRKMIKLHWHLFFNWYQIGEKPAGKNGVYYQFYVTSTRAATRLEPTPIYFLF